MANGNQVVEFIDCMKNEGRIASQKQRGILMSFDNGSSGWLVFVCCISGVLKDEIVLKT